VFASQVKSTFQIEGCDVRIRKLSARSLDKASEIRQGSVVAMARGFGPELMAVFRGDVGPQPERVAQTERETVYATYDRDSVLVAGIESWDAKHADGKKMDLEEGIADLDEDSANALFHAIIDLSVPTKEQVEEEQGKSFGLSTVS